MPLRTTYTNARANLASLLNSVSEDHEIVIINRRRAKDVALIAADELASLLETAHLLRSPKNVGRLLSTVKRVRERTLYKRYGLSKKSLFDSGVDVQSTTPDRYKD